MTDLEIMDSIIEDLNENQDDLLPAEMIGADPTALVEFIEDAVEAFITESKPLDKSHLKNLFLVGMVVGAEFRNRKTSQ